MLSWLAYVYRFEAQWTEQQYARYLEALAVEVVRL